MSRLRAELKALDSPDAPDGLESFAPDDPEHFRILVEASIGPAGEVGAELFGFNVCTPSWLAEETDLTKSFTWLRHHLLVSRWDLTVVERAIQDRCRRTEGSDWPSIAIALSRYGLWEFEDYHGN